MTSPRTLLTAWQIPARKQFGQNFLVNPNTAAAIVRYCGVGEEDVVIEIGPGMGGLTIPLARAVRRVQAVEKDYRMVDLLRSELLAAGVENVEVTPGDVLDLDFAAAANRLGRTPVVVGNLPYNISSQILVKLIAQRQSLDRAVLMFQKELAQRLMAQPGSRSYGRITAMLHYCAQIRPLMELNANQFFPRPNIDSMLVELRFPRPPLYSVANESFLFEVVKAAFGKRRKTLKNALSKGELSVDAETVQRVLVSVGIDPTRRAESLSVQEFAALSNALLQQEFRG